MITDGQIVDLITQGLMTIIIVAAPPLILGLLAGLILAIFQTVTSIQEQTLAFIPKIVAVLGSLIFFGPFMLGRLREFFSYVLDFMTRVV